MPSAAFTLFEVPSKPPCRSWSMNPWKTRFLLNFKGLDYKTEWVEYPQIRTRLEGHVPPNDGHFPYTVPTVILPDGSYVSESRRIASFIEEQYPEPSVHLDAPILAKVEDALKRMPLGFFALLAAKIPKRILNEGSQDYWYATRNKIVGMHVDEFERVSGGDAAIAEIGPVVREITALLKKDTDGPFFMGRTVSYADFIWAGILIFCQRTGPEVLEQLLSCCPGDEGVHRVFLDGLRPWWERDGY